MNRKDAKNAKGKGRIETRRERRHTENRKCVLFFYLYHITLCARG
jgi:hypothetical protein